MYIELENVKLYLIVVEVVKEVDLIVIGLGSLYISILLNLLFMELVDEIIVSKVLKVYIMNILM